MKKLPPLPKSTSKKVVRVDVSPKTPKRVGPMVVEDKKFRPAAVVQASTAEFKRHLEELGQDKSETDKKIAEMRPQIERMKEIQEASDQKIGAALTVEEQTVILEAHFNRGVGPKAIAQVIGRPHSTVSRFIQRYTSTAPIAAATLKAGAETLARRVLKNANVTEALEVLDRVDALPKKDRSKSVDNSPRFNIIVATPGAPSTIAPPVPSQALIEASVTKENS